MPSMIFSLEDHLRLFGTWVREHVSRMPEAEMNLTVLGCFSHTDRYMVIGRLATDETTCIGGRTSVLICISQVVISMWVFMHILHVLRRV